ncbi:MAG: dipeptide/oligopeptide/nickel ABC transporter ATP-binding protein [Nitrospira sp.]
MSLKVVDLSKSYRSGFWGNKVLEAVSQVSFELGEGETLGLVGESGCGKTTISKIILGLLKPTSGRIVYQGRDITNLSARQWRPLRQEIQAVFQHPQMTFHPRRSIYFACAEPIRLYGLAKNKDEERELVYRLIDEVGLTREQLTKYPHEISGGQAQRLSIVRALSLQPKVLICDEPDLDAGRFSAGADLAVAARDPHPAAAVDALYLARSRSHPGDVRSRRRHVGGRDRRDRAKRRGLLEPPARIHENGCWNRTSA